ncbi:cytochrome c oxidase subunit 7B, mitochondrial isoform X1 [Nannospalax galili]|uniref:cytochrome c oxidase subunit 7B, mitochondrial isoform X1 n=1 Tax=Nannospalax galili TaxID=1026970 RepID=UPI00111C6509|nr:cytochrome c oxidase subunit 7B, mitochondrial isoform X1 [Nannospalax galili]
MFPLAKTALSRLQVRSILQTMARQSHQKRAPDFHDKYGNAILASGAIFCISTWTYAGSLRVEDHPQLHIKFDASLGYLESFLKNKKKKKENQQEKE